MHWHIGKPVRFVHAADLHLDSPYKGLALVPPDFSERLRRATFDTFDNIIQLCLTERADFLLIAGDVFNVADKSLLAQLRFRDGLSRLSESGIPSYVVHGNHDPLDGWSSTLQYAPEVNIFGPHVNYFEYEVSNGEAIRIYGFSYPRRAETRNMAREFPPRPKKPAARTFRIALLHCNVGANPQHLNYAPCELTDLAAADVDYWALGHVHERQILAQDPHVVYPGNTQGCSFREPGSRGCNLVEVRPDGQVDVEFRDVSAVRWEVSSVSIQDVTSVQGLERNVNDALSRLRQAAKKPLVVRLALTGKGPLYAELKRDQALEDLLEHQRRAQLRHAHPLWLDRIEMHALPEIDLAQMGERPDLIGSILRLADEYEANLETSLAPVLDTLWDDPKYKNHLEALSPEDLRQILTEARLLCVEHLGGLG